MIIMRSELSFFATHIPSYTWATSQATLSPTVALGMRGEYLECTPCVAAMLFLPLPAAAEARDRSRVDMAVCVPRVSLTMHRHARLEPQPPPAEPLKLRLSRR